MIGTRSVAVTLAATLGLAASACSTLDVEDYCRYSEDRSIREADPESLALAIGVQPGRARQTPFIVFRNLSEKSPDAFLRLSSSPALHPMPVDLDESRCGGVDWSTYDLSVDPEEWHAFWQHGTMSHVEIGIAFLEDNRPLPLSAFGAAILDTNAADHLVSCGCYWR